MKIAAAVLLIGPVRVVGWQWTGMARERTVEPFNGNTGFKFLLRDRFMIGMSGVGEGVMVNMAHRDGRLWVAER